jgi:hypothetical protein
LDVPKKSNGVITLGEWAQAVKEAEEVPGYTSEEIAAALGMSKLRKRNADQLIDKGLLRLSGVRKKNNSRGASFCNVYEILPPKKETPLLDVVRVAVHRGK